MLERHELDTFLTLCEELHFGRTAERLRVSTSRVRQTVRALERRVGVPLFDRTSRRVELSPAGRALRDDLRPHWEAIGEAVARAVEAGRGYSGELRVCFTEPQHGLLLTGVAELFGERHPECAVHLREARPDEVPALLRDGAAEVAMAERAGAVPERLSASAVLVSEARFVAVPAGHPLARADALRSADLEDATVLTTSSLTTPEALTQVGAGRGVLPVGASARRYHARPDVAYVHVEDAPPVETHLLWHTSSASARVRAFTEAAQDLVTPPGRPPERPVRH
ncbi:LysR substrate-binding domain-containing protein [Nocardiopsis sp. RSe5-2]|uniref:LysR substrate-binding domain-containing protein n=1 Tax=Nocardiopsis endophytica TaxID=3018445 RepID=A0ABT4TWN8_9ACTN|nr:LysR substrate-binding domain-containing protein [Nocardiopsis endophytica]MDA2809110.1 LysR substrate-binding domain-containing protein [Nocardiopsis endophytica]